MTGRHIVRGTPRSGPFSPNGFPPFPRVPAVRDHRPVRWIHASRLYTDAVSGPWKCVAVPPAVWRTCLDECLLSFDRTVGTASRLELIVSMRFLHRPAEDSPRGLPWGLQRHNVCVTSKPRSYNSAPRWYITRRTGCGGGVCRQHLSLGSWCFGSEDLFS
ncbi:hypothetical protein MTO96_022160 [Rhipicephalus appendiculatus]